MVISDPLLALFLVPPLMVKPISVSLTLVQIGVECTSSVDRVHMQNGPRPTHLKGRKLDARTLLREARTFVLSASCGESIEVKVGSHVI